MRDYNGNVLVMLWEDWKSQLLISCVLSFTICAQNNGSNKSVRYAL